MTRLRTYDAYVSAMAGSCVLFDGPSIGIEGVSVKDALARSFPSYEFVRNPSTEDFAPENIFYTVGPSDSPFGAKKTFWWGARRREGSQ